jgi:hypothetical protein
VTRVEERRGKSDRGQGRCCGEGRGGINFCGDLNELSLDILDLSTNQMQKRRSQVEGGEETFDKILASVVFESEMSQEGRGREGTSGTVWSSFGMRRWAR